MNDIAIKAYNEAINFAVDYAKDTAAVFLNMWREGDWDGIKKEYPDFDLTSIAKIHIGNIKNGAKGLEYTENSHFKVYHDEAD